MRLTEQFQDQSTQTQIAEDCTHLMDEQVAAKSGIGGMAIKAAYGALKGINAGYVTRAIENLLPKAIIGIDPMWQEGLAQGDPVNYLSQNQDRAAEIILGVTDQKIKGAQNKLVIGTYNKLRKSVKGDVEAAIPGLAKIISQHSNAAS